MSCSSRRAIEALAERFGCRDDSSLLAVGAAARAHGYYTRRGFSEIPLGVSGELLA